MGKIGFTALAAIALLTGCGQANESAQMLETKAQGDTAESATPMSANQKGTDTEANDVPSADIKVSLPQIAYIYQYGFRIGASDIPALQSEHADLCEKKGPSVCRILNLAQSGGEGDYANASLEMEIAAPRARRFGDELAGLAKSKGGEPVNTSISGEDLSKQMVDTEARLRARIVLRDRLMEILKSRSGKVSELVEAERGVAAVNEEIDQAQSWLAEMKGRVAFSKMTVQYSSGSPSAGGFLEPIRYALGAAGSILGTTIAFIIGALIFLLPWAAIILIILWSRRRFGWRLRFWQSGNDVSNTDEPSQQS